MPAETKKKRYSYREDDPKIRGGAELYGSARTKLRKARGKASEHSCAECGEPASVWIFRPRRNAETWVDPLGLKFSLDPRDYVALCSTDAAAARKKQKARDAAKAGT